MARPALEPLVSPRWQTSLFVACTVVSSSFMVIEGRAQTGGAPPTSPQPTAETAPPPAAPEAAPPPAGPGAQQTQETTPAATPAPAPAGPPPAHYYVEPAQPPASAPRAYEPPPPPLLVHEPMPPPVTEHRAPKSAFWVGPRVGLMVPFGTLWHDGFLCADSLGFLYRCYHARAWTDYASPGPFFEIDAGARLGRLYNVFGLWEHASFGTGGLEENSFGGQNRGDSDLFGIGLRFSTEPDTVGFLIELAIGYRQFTAHWEDGTELKMRDGWFDARIGLGADIRLSRLISLSPLLTFGSGGFGDAEWDGPSRSGDARTALDVSGQYNTLSLQLGAHFDLFAD